MQQEKNGQHENPGKEDVIITIDDKEWEIHRGHHTVADLKMMAGIPLAYDLDMVIDGKFDPMPDNGGVTIKGGEVFISHVKDGSSS